MIAVIVCSLFNITLLVGLIAGMVVGFVRARHSIAAALAYAPPAPFTTRVVRLAPA
jgi:hypothetical protein